MSTESTPSAQSPQSVRQVPVPEPATGNAGEGRHFASAPRPIHDIAVLLARVLLGVTLMAHGWQKINDWGLDGTAESFTKMGTPSPQLSAVIAAWVELGGGALIVIGLLTPLAALVVALDMAGAFWFGHRGTEVFVSEGGWELVAMIGVSALLLLVTGPGRISVDRLVRRIFTGK